MKKIVTVVGARPQFIKAATVSRALSGRGAREVLVHTGQHYDSDMSKVFFEQMGIPAPTYNLGVGGGPHGAMTGRQMEKVEEILIAERPDWVLVFGDTNSTLAGALASAKLQIPVAHVEAGLRSFNRAMPEEINRVLTDHISKLLFAPTRAAVRNLASEGLVGEGVMMVGDVMLDATLFFKSKAKKPDWFRDLDIPAGDFVLSTIHRAENTDDVSRLRGIIDGLGACGLPVVIPLHPRTRDALRALQLPIPANINFVSPVGYLEMTWLEINCRGIATDSGGIQKEAYFHKKPCVTLREETEWVELAEAGVNVLVGTDSNKIASAISSWSGNIDFDTNLYGDGSTAEAIVEAML